MKRSRALLICLLLLLLAIPVIWKLAGASAARSRTTSVHSLSLPGSDALSAAGNGEDKISRRPVDYEAKAKSMLELRVGELGIVPVPAGFIDAEALPCAPAGGDGAPQLRGMMPRKLARLLLEKALREGASIQAKVGAGGEGIDWKGEKIGITARLDNPDAGFPELQMESAVGGEKSSKMSMQIPAGGCVVVRYPSGETVLVAIGGGAEQRSDEAARDGQ